MRRVILALGIGLLGLPRCHLRDRPPGGPETAGAAAREERMEERRRMVESQIAARGVRDPRVIAAMERVPRHRFIPPGLQHEAYDDHPVPIGQGQTISQPYIVAAMTEALGVGPGARVLEIGTGSGYQAAVLAEVVGPEGRVHSIEILEPLARQAARTLEDLGYRDVRLRVGDGWFGWPEEAPFLGILGTAAPREVPPALLQQLAVDGVLVAPIGEGVQDLVRIRRTRTGYDREVLMGVRFVPMTGQSDGR